MRPNFLGYVSSECMLSKVVQKRHFGGKRVEPLKIPAMKSAPGFQWNTFLEPF